MRRAYDYCSKKEFSRLRNIGSCIRSSSAELGLTFLAQTGKDLEDAALKADVDASRAILQRAETALDDFKKAAKQLQADW